MSYSPRTFTSSENIRIEQAIAYLVNEYTKSGKNPKPVIFHSIRVAGLLVPFGYGADTVIAAYLHDMVEDTDSSISDIDERFGENIAKMVDLLTFDSTISDKEIRYRKNFESIAQASNEEVIVIRCADLLDNSTYYSFGHNQQHEKFLLEKMKYFIDTCLNNLDAQPVASMLKDRYQELLNTFQQAW